MNYEWYNRLVKLEVKSYRSKGKFVKVLVKNKSNTHSSANDRRLCWLHNGPVTYSSVSKEF